MIKYFSRPTKTTLHSGSITKNWRTGLYCPRTEKHPQPPYEPVQEMPFEWIWGITIKYLRRVDWRNIRSLRSRHTPSLSGSTMLRKKKKIYATTRCKSQEEEVLTVIFFLFSKKKKRKKKKENSWKRGVVRPKLTCIMDSSSTISLCEIPLLGSSIIIP